MTSASFANSRNVTAPPTSIPSTNASLSKPITSIVIWQPIKETPISCAISTNSGMPGTFALANPSWKCSFPSGYIIYLHGYFVNPIKRGDITITTHGSCLYTLLLYKLSYFLKDSFSNHIHFCKVHGPYIDGFKLFTKLLSISKI